MLSFSSLQSDEAVFEDAFSILVPGNGSEESWSNKIQPQTRVTRLSGSATYYQ